MSSDDVARLAEIAKHLDPDVTPHHTFVSHAHTDIAWLLALVAKLAAARAVPAPVAPQDEVNT